MMTAAINGAPEEGDYQPQSFISRNVWIHLSRGDAETASSGLNRLEELLLNVDRHRLRASADHARIVADGQIIDLSRRGPARAIVEALVNAFPEPVDPWELLEVGWPEVRVNDPSILNRLYTTLHRLRRDGLEDFIETSDAGYSLSVKPGPLS